MGHSHGTKWTDDLIAEKIVETRTALGLDRMPSESEVKGYFKDCALSNAVSRRGGWYHWANKLGLPIKNSETYIGKIHENEVLERLISLGFEVRQMPTVFPYDILVNDCIKIDVKASRLYRGTAGNFYSFNLEKPFSTCDIYVLCSLDDDGLANGIYVVPSKFVATNTQVSIGEKVSKYSRFKGRWDYVEQYSAFLETV